MEVIEDNFSFVIFTCSAILAVFLWAATRRSSEYGSEFAFLNVHFTKFYVEMDE